MNKYKTTYPGLEDMIITKEELVEGTYHIHLERQKTRSMCLRCTHMTSKVHNYRIQKTWHAYNRKIIKRLRTVLYKRNLSPLKRKELMRYLSYSEELTEAYQLKESFVQWFDRSKESKNISEVKNGLIDWYEEVLASNCEPMKRTVMTFKRWQTEILNSFVYGYTNGFVEGLNNKTKVIKRAAYGFRSFYHFRAKILLSHKYKNIGSHLG